MPHEAWLAKPPYSSIASGANEGCHFFIDRQIMIKLSIEKERRGLRVS
ncbi:protein of unknown function [Mesotoga infera]|uniref:Uncharacterized protein n=1 Tax=Mesotoga infera TaxID=1236046 RepID=A0A7Z7LGT4_9BACT|nr:protein of unknown function [Mesotoga infera]